jgi:hypothetical protein
MNRICPSISRENGMNKFASTLLQRVKTKTALVLFLLTGFLILLYESHADAMHYLQEFVFFICYSLFHISLNT